MADLDLIGSMRKRSEEDRKRLKKDKVISPDLSKMKRERIDAKTWVFR
jgi:hypothetical protein